MNITPTRLSDDVKNIKKNVTDIKKSLKDCEGSDKDSVVCVFERLIKKIDRVTFEAKQFLENDNVQKPKN